MLRWAVEIERLDILLEVSISSHHLGLPCEVHSEQVMHFFGSSMQPPKRKIAYDFYRNAREAIPTNAPAPRGQMASTH